MTPGHLLNRKLIMTGLTLLLILQIPFLLRGMPIFLERMPLYAFSDISARMLKGGTLISFKIAYIGMIFLLVAQFYSVRKRLANGFGMKLGSRRNWLAAHCVIDLIAPTLLLIHSGLPFNFTYANFFMYIHLELGLRGLVGFQGLAAWMVLMSVASGFFGRYLYGRLDKKAKWLFRRWRIVHIVISAALYITGSIHLVVAVWFRYVSAIA